MPSKNLEPGQFQIGNLVMGEYTLYKIESLDIGNYDVNMQDSQVQGSNSIDFGIDTKKPASMQLTINVLRNKMMENVAALQSSVPMLNFSDDPGLHELQAEWLAEDTLMEWGEQKPLFFCGTDGITRQFFGRPGKFAYKNHKIVGSAYHQVTAEFRRADTLGYSETEWYVPFNPGEVHTISLSRGTATNPVRIVIKGPAIHPIIDWGTTQFELDWTIPVGKSAEITSYPWLGRRCIDTDGLSLSAFLIMPGSMPYLDRLKMYPNSNIDIAWNAAGTNDDSEMRVCWHDGYAVLD